LVLKSARILGALVLAAGLLVPGSAFAQRETTREGLSRLEEVLAMRVEDGGLTLKDLTPAIVVSTRPSYEETRTWYPNAALASLVRVFGSASLRSCEACMLPRTTVSEERIEQVAVDLGTSEIVAVDESVRGTAPPARTAIWLDETEEGVSLRMIDLRNGRILLAENLDPFLAERRRTAQQTSFARELDRRIRGDSITHTFTDIAMYPYPHVSFDWSEQWGQTNANLSGVSMSLFSPILGVGGTYARAIPSAYNILVGGKVLMSVPTALVSSVTGKNQTIIDPLVTGVAFVRIPIGHSNYGVVVTGETTGHFGVGISLLNSSFLPFLP
jgi:hypothetical protein